MATATKLVKKPVQAVAAAPVPLVKKKAAAGEMWQVRCTPEARKYLRTFGKYQTQAQANAACFEEFLRQVDAHVEAVKAMVVSPEGERTSLMRYERML